MAHSRLNLNAMFDWIERNATHDVRMPTDGEICERFNFESRESARTLLAELADAGKITIRGYGDDRVITIGRSKSALSPAPRAEPPVRKADPEVERVAARITEIVQRGSKAVAAANAQALIKTVTAKPAQKKQAATVRKEAVMPVEKQETTSAAKRQHSSPAPARPSPSDKPADSAFSVEALLDMLRARFDERPDQSAELASAIERAEAAEARADAAEAKFAQAKALFA